MSGNFGVWSSPLLTTTDAFAVTLHFENNDFLRRFLGRTLAGS